VTLTTIDHLSVFDNGPNTEQAEAPLQLRPRSWKPGHNIVDRYAIVWCSSAEAALFEFTCQISLSAEQLSTVDLLYVSICRLFYESPVGLGPPGGGLA